MTNAFGPDFVQMDMKDFQDEMSSETIEEYDTGNENVVYHKGEEPSSYDKNNLLDRAVKLIHNICSRFL